MKKIKMYILNLLVKRMFKGLTEEDVFTLIGNKFYINGELCGREVSLVYRDEALKFRESPLWKELNKKIAYKAEESMFKKSKTIDDMFFGKVMLYNLDLIDKYLEKISKIK